MPSVYYDAHVHSCLSPCADDDMTPNNILGMAALKGLDLLAVTDHNACGNLPALARLSSQYNLTFVPGIEITTREEAHVLGYFPTVECALAMGAYCRAHLLPMKNKPDIFGNQLICNEDDDVTATEDAMLIGATDLSIEDVFAHIRALGGVPVPAHINRGANGVLQALGFIPETLLCTAAEVWRDLPCPHGAREGKVVLHSSDAHSLGNISEREQTLALRENSVDAFLARLRQVE